MCVSIPVGMTSHPKETAQKINEAYAAMKEANAPCSQCGAKSFRLTSDHGNWKHICSYCGSDK